MVTTWWPNTFYLKVCGLKETKDCPFFINLVDICLILFCLLFTTKSVYN